MRNRIRRMASSCALLTAALISTTVQAHDVVGFTGFSAERGEHLFKTNFSTGKPDTPSCTTCHTTDPRKTGQTRAGKDIEPMAASVNSKRYSDQAKTEKWFGRNCNNVLGRECTATEKGDFITFMLAQ